MKKDKYCIGKIGAFENEFNTFIQRMLIWDSKLLNYVKYLLRNVQCLKLKIKKTFIFTKQ